MKFYNRTSSWISDNCILSCDIDCSGVIWIRKEGCGLAQFEGTTWIFYKSSKFYSLLKYAELINFDVNINTSIEVLDSELMNYNYGDAISIKQYIITNIKDFSLQKIPYLYNQSATLQSNFLSPIFITITNYNTLCHKVCIWENQKQTAYKCTKV